jgi:hypothetical protein
MNTAAQAHASLAATAAALFAEAAAVGRDSLDQPGMVKLLGGLEIPLAAGPAGSTPVALRIRLENTREFGMVLSAGSGGLDAGLDASNFTRDRAAVHAAAELTDATLFLQLFRRTLAWQKLAAARPATAQPLTACFDLALAEPGGRPSCPAKPGNR